MPNFCRLLFLACATVALGLLPRSALAQSFDLDSYERVDVDTLPEAHRRWIQEEVSVIITDTERQVFLRLPSDARRDDFIERFWAVRDPSPGTSRNEYRELHYERFAHVVATFGRGISGDGWRTDMGRIYLLLGKPQQTNRLPNTTQAVPIEVWFYNVDPAYGTPPFFYLIFFKARGIGEYRLYSPAIDGPEALLNPSGRADVDRGAGSGGRAGRGQFSAATTQAGRAIAVLRQVDPELGNAAASLVPGDAAGGMISPLRSEMVLSRIFDIPSRLMPQPAWAFRALVGEAAATVRFETLPMQSIAHVLFDPSGLPFVHFATRTMGDKLNLNNYQDEYYVTFNVASAIRDADLRVLEDRPSRTLQADLDEETARRLRAGPVVYIERMPLLEGDYFLDVMVENNLTRQFARATFELRVPDLEGKRIDAVAPVLALEAARIEQQYEEFADQYPYQMGSRMLIPAAGGPFANDSSAHLYWQIYVPETHAEPVVVVYVISDSAGTVLIDRRVHLQPTARRSAALIEVYTEIELRGLEAGDYRVTATIEGIDDLQYEMPLQVVAAEAYVRPFVHAVREPPASGVDTALARARQMRIVGQTERAIDVLDGILSRDAGNEGAFALQVELLTDAGRHADLAELIAPRLVAEPNDAQLLLQMGSLQAQLGQHYDAIRYYERALLAGSAETTELLNALASEYYAEGDAERTRALLRRSLELNAEQPQILRLLEELLGTSG